MPTDPNRPNGNEQDGNETPTEKNLAKIAPPDAGVVPTSPDEERLVRVFEQLFIHHDRVDEVPALTGEQVTLALRLQEEDRKRSHERMMLRDTQRHEVTLARQRDEAEERKRRAELRKSRFTFLPSLIFLFGFLALLGTALIIYILVANGAKEQIGIVLAFLSGVIGGVLAGFGGGYTIAKLLPTAKTEKDEEA